MSADFRTVLPPWVTWASVLIVAAGLGLRCVGIDESLDGDEVFSTDLASLSLSATIAGALADRTQGPLHILLLHLWVHLFGDSELSARSLSIVFSAGFLWVMRAIALERFGKRGALGLLILVAAGAYFVYYGQQARPYALTLLLTALSMRYFFSLLDRPDDRRTWIWWGVAGGLAVWSSYLAVLGLGVQAVILIALHRRAALGPMLIAITMGLPLVAWVVSAFSSTRPGAEALGLISWIDKPGALDFVLFYLGIPGIVPGVRLWILAAFMALLILPAVLLLIRKAGDPGVDVRWLALLAIAPPVVVFGLSHFTPVSLWAPRQMTHSVVAIALLTGVALDRLPSIVATIALAAVTGWVAFGVGDAFPSASKPPWLPIVRDADAWAGAAGPVLVTPSSAWAAIPLRRYAGRDRVVDAETLGKQKVLGRIAGVCRPVHCEELTADAARLGYWPMARRSYPWNTFGGEPTSLVVLIEFERVTAKAGRRP